jgi:heterodisulfide reductase subunit A-like polyferredoxin
MWGRLQEIFISSTAQAVFHQQTKMTVETTPRVIICGAGPVGLFVALKLSRAHIPCLVLEKVSSLMIVSNFRPLIFSKPLVHVDILHLALPS